MKKKNRIYNLVMGVLILIIIACGIVITGKTKGWFTDGESAQIHCAKMTGIANVQRNGVSYRAKEKLALKGGDFIETENHANLDLAVKETGGVCMSGASALKINEDTKPIITVEKGIVFADIQGAEGIELCLEGMNLVLQKAVVSLSVYEGSCTVSVLEGTVELNPDGEAAEQIRKGEQYSLLSQDGKEFQIEKKKLQIETLDDFSIQRAIESSREVALCFSEKELVKVLEAREKEAAQVRAEAGQNGQSKVNIKENTEENIEENTGGATSVVWAEAGDPEVQLQTGEGDRDTVIKGGDSTDKSKSDDSTVEKKNYCMIEIRCDTILGHMEDLSPGKDVYVPANGLILATSTIEFSEGETAFDVLKRVCELSGIQLEYQYTPGYGSYYIEGINNLYEFDCGSESGWVYKINGWTANYGCSSCYLKDGDVVSWVYSCVGYGSDV